MFLIYYSIKFRKTAYRCKDCRVMAHTECKNLVPLPCVPAGNTPTLRGKPVSSLYNNFCINSTYSDQCIFTECCSQGTIADYTPITPPMVPSIVVHCVNEIELRGMNEQGLYRVDGVGSDVKCLKEKFLKGKGAPNLSNIDIPTICSTLKRFLRYTIILNCYT